MNLIDEILKYQHEVERQGNELAKSMFAELSRVRSKVLGMLIDLEDEILKTDFSNDSLTRRKKLLQHQRDQIEKVMVQVYQDTCGPIIIDRSEEVMTATSKETAILMNNVLSVSRPFYHLDKKLVQAWFESATVEGMVLNEWLQKIGQNAADRILKVQRQSMIEGLSVQKMASNMRKRGFEGSRPAMANLARTLLHSASHYAREKTVMSNFRDDIQGWKYVATLDRRTCPVCGADDGKFYALDENKPVLPQHWSCRCSYVPVPKEIEGVSIDDLGNRPAVKHSSRTVHHRDGSTSTKFMVEEVEHTTETYQTWLKRMSHEDPAFVEKVLGKRKAELFKKGKITLDHMG